MTLAALLREHQTALLAQYGARLTVDHHRAMQAMLRCHTPEAGQLEYYCPDCQKIRLTNLSCGHRNCPQCGQHHNQQWLERQQKKLLPTHYYLVTFTLPRELRRTALNHPRTVYNVLMKAAVDTLQTFAGNDATLGGTLGITAVLHTHTRALDIHPHVHLVVPAGCLSLKGKLWRQKNGRYLFNGKNLGTVFRAKFLHLLAATDLKPRSTLPKHWIAHCKRVGHGLSALTYLSRYLYRGVISERNILGQRDGCVTYQYKDSKTKKMRQRTEPAVTFLWKVLQHVLPKGFRRVRDYGFLSGPGKRTLQRLQLMLKVRLPAEAVAKVVNVCCPDCHQPMTFMEFVSARQLRLPFRTT